MNLKKALIVSLSAFVFLLVGGSFSLPLVEDIAMVEVAEAAKAEHGDASAAEEEDKGGSQQASPWKSMAAAIALMGGCLGTGLAQSRIGAAGVGAMAERPETATMVIVMLAIPETIVILSFVVAAMLIMF